jgi:hypothetical protein
VVIEQVSILVVEGPRMAVVREQKVEGVIGCAVDWEQKRPPPFVGLKEGLLVGLVTHAVTTKTLAEGANY